MMKKLVAIIVVIALVIVWTSRSMKRESRITGHEQGLGGERGPMALRTLD